MNEPSTVKYVIKLNLSVNGVVEKSDVVGAIFGQLEGFLGRELDLRELQRTGRIGRIDVSLQSKAGKTRGTITIPSSLGKVETAIIAAAVETVDKIGPCSAQIQLSEIIDVRSEKRNAIRNRAIRILEEWEQRETAKIENLLQEIEQSIRMKEVKAYGPEKLPAGPEVEGSSEIIIVEGRADVINLLKHGIRNAIAVEGTSIPKSVQELSRRKQTTAFLDGDRGGELILKELVQVADVDFVAFAPPGRSVEELTEKEIMTALKSRIPVDQYLEQKTRHLPVKAQIAAKKEIARSKAPYELQKLVERVVGSLKVYYLDQRMDILGESAVEAKNLGEIEKQLETLKPRFMVFDGIITQRLIDVAAKHGVKVLAGVKRGDITRIPYPLKVYTFDELLEKGLPPS